MAEAERRVRMSRGRMFAAFLSVALGGPLLVALLFPDVWETPSELTFFVYVLHQLPVLLATLFVQGPLLKQPVLGPLGFTGRPNRWWLVAWLAPVAMLAVALAVGALLGDAPALTTEDYIAHRRAGLDPALRESFAQALVDSPPSNPLRYVLNALLVGPLFPLLIALFTEVGFRGFLFREVQGGFWRRSALIGLAEAAFLAPLGAFGYQFPGEPLLGAVLLGAWAMLASPALVYLRVRSGSVLAVALFRGTLFALTTVAADLSGASATLRPFYGVAGFAALAVLLLAFFLHDRRAEARLMSPGAPPQGKPAGN
ncbi:MAG: CPBP family glutamic-type intramembrane protease [Myxococcota bacterium]